MSVADVPDSAGPAGANSAIELIELDAVVQAKRSDPPPSDASAEPKPSQAKPTDEFSLFNSVFSAFNVEGEDLASYRVLPSVFSHFRPAAAAAPPPPWTVQPLQINAKLPNPILPSSDPTSVPLVQRSYLLLDHLLKQSGEQCDTLSYPPGTTVDAVLFYLLHHVVSTAIAADDFAARKRQAAAAKVVQQVQAPLLKSEIMSTEPESKKPAADSDEPKQVEITAEAPATGNAASMQLRHCMNRLQQMTPAELLAASGYVPSDFDPLIHTSRQLFEPKVGEFRFQLTKLSWFKVQIAALLRCLTHPSQPRAPFGLIAILAEFKMLLPAARELCANQPVDMLTTLRLSLDDCTLIFNRFQVQPVVQGAANSVKEPWVNKMREAVASGGRKSIAESYLMPRTFRHLLRRMALRPAQVHNMLLYFYDLGSTNTVEPKASASSSSPHVEIDILQHGGKKINMSALTDHGIPLVQQRFICKWTALTLAFYLAPEAPPEVERMPSQPLSPSMALSPASSSSPAPSPTANSEGRASSSSSVESPQAGEISEIEVKTARLQQQCAYNKKVDEEMRSAFAKVMKYTESRGDAIQLLDAIEIDESEIHESMQTSFLTTSSTTWALIYFLVSQAFGFFIWPMNVILVAIRQLVREGYIRNRSDAWRAVKGVLPRVFTRNKSSKKEVAAAKADDDEKMGKTCCTLRSVCTAISIFIMFIFVLALFVLLGAFFLALFLLIATLFMFLHTSIVPLSVLFAEHSAHGSLHALEGMFRSPALLFMPFLLMQILLIYASYIAAFYDPAANRVCDLTLYHRVALYATHNHRDEAVCSNLAQLMQELPLMSQIAHRKELGRQMAQRTASASDSKSTWTTKLGDLAGTFLELCLKATPVVAYFVYVIYLINPSSQLHFFPGDCATAARQQLADNGFGCLQKYCMNGWIDRSLIPDVSSVDFSFSLASAHKELHLGQLIPDLLDPNVSSVFGCVPTELQWYSIGFLQAWLCVFGALMINNGRTIYVILKRWMSVLDRIHALVIPSRRNLYLSFDHACNINAWLVICRDIRFSLSTFLSGPFFILISVIAVGATALMLALVVFHDIGPLFFTCLPFALFGSLIVVAGLISTATINSKFYELGDPLKNELKKRELALQLADLNSPRAPAFPCKLSSASSVAVDALSASLDAHAEERKRKQSLILQLRGAVEVFEQHFSSGAFKLFGVAVSQKMVKYAVINALIAGISPLIGLLKQVQL